MWKGIVSKITSQRFYMEKNILKFNEKIMKNYDENNDKRYILEVDIKYPKNLHNLHDDLPFLKERMKIKK